MPLLIQFAPAIAGSKKQNEDDEPAVRAENGRLSAAARWWWLNWSRFAQGRLDK